MSDDLKSRLKPSSNNKLTSIVKFDDIKKKIQNLRSKQENTSEIKSDLEINKDFLNSFKRNSESEVKGSLMLNQVEGMNCNNITNTSFIKEQNNNNSFLLGKNDKKENLLSDQSNFLSNLNLDRSRDRESKSEVINQKFIKIKNNMNKDIIGTSKVPYLKARLTDTNLSTENDKSPKSINTKLLSLTEKLHHSDKNNNVLDRNNLCTLNIFSKGVDHSPSRLPNRKVEDMRKSIMSCFGDKKEVEKKFYEKPKESVFEEFLEKKSKIESIYTLNSKKIELQSEYGSNISGKSCNSDTKKVSLIQTKSSINSSNKLKNRIEDFVKNIDKDPKSELNNLKNLNKLNSFTDFSQKTSLLQRKPEVKLNLSPNPSNLDPSKYCKNKSLDYNCISISSNFTGNSKDRTTTLNDEQLVKKVPESYKKDTCDILEKIMKIEDIKNLTSQLRFLSEDNIKSLNEKYYFIITISYVFELKSLCSVINKMFNNENSSSSSYVLKKF